MHSSGSWSVLGRNLLELVHLVGDCAPRVLVSSEWYRRLRQLLSRTSQRYEPLAERAMPFTDDQWRERKLVSRYTDLCIEGFPGSGTSFVSNSLRMAVDRPTNIESHFHQTAQLKRALSFGVPAVVVVRDPAGACASLRSKEPSLAAWVVLLRWIQYHRWVGRHLDVLEVFLFEELIDDVDALRKISAEVAAVVASEIKPIAEFRRTSLRPIPIDETPFLNRTLLRSARSIHARIEEHCRQANGGPRRAPSSRS